MNTAKYWVVSAVTLTVLILLDKFVLRPNLYDFSLTYIVSVQGHMSNFGKTCWTLYTKSSIIVVAALPTIIAIA
jgi:hypothetical protein